MTLILWIDDVPEVYDFPVCSRSECLKNLDFACTMKLDGISPDGVTCAKAVIL